MINTTQTSPTLAEWHRESPIIPALKESPDCVVTTLSGRLNASDTLRDYAAILDAMVPHLARILPDRADARADLAALREIAGNLGGYGETMEATA